MHCVQTTVHFQVIFNGDLINMNDYVSHFTDLLTEQFLNDFGVFIDKEMPRIMKPSRPKKRSLDLPPEIFESFSNLNIKNSNTDRYAAVSCQIPSSELFLNPSQDELNSSSLKDGSAFAYNIMSFITEQVLNNTVKPSLPEYFEFQRSEYTEKSNVKFLFVLNETADSRETILLTLNKLYNDLGIHRRINYLVVVGDGKTYDHLIQLKNEEKEDLSWLLP